MLLSHYVLEQGKGLHSCVWDLHTSSSPVFVVTTSMSEFPSSSTVSSSSPVGVAGRNWKGVLAPLISPVCVT